MSDGGRMYLTEWKRDAITVILFSMVIFFMGRVINAIYLPSQDTIIYDIQFGLTMFGAVFATAFALIAVAPDLRSWVQGVKVEEK